MPVTRLVEQAYTSGEADEVHIVYTRYINTLLQEPVTAQLLPIATEGLEAGNVDYICGKSNAETNRMFTRC